MGKKGGGERCKEVVKFGLQTTPGQCAPAYKRSLSKKNLGVSCNVHICVASNELAFNELDIEMQAKKKDRILFFL